MGLPEQLSPFNIFGLDTTIFIYHLEAHPVYLTYTRPIFSAIASNQKQAVTSTITLMEIIVQPLHLGREDVARKYEALLANFPNLTIADIDRNVARQAARLRAGYNIRTADALQIAACLVHGAEVLITNDRRLERLKHLIDVVVLDDMKAGK